MKVVLKSQGVTKWYVLTKKGSASKIPDLANKSTRCQVKLGFQVNNW